MLTRSARVDKERFLCSYSNKSNGMIRADLSSDFM